MFILNIRDQRIPKGQAKVGSHNSHENSSDNLRKIKYINNFLQFNPSIPKQENHNLANGRNVRVM